MKKVLQNIIESFNNGDKGFSSKKLTAFTVMACIVAAHIKWITMGNFAQLEMVLTIDFSFVSVLYGINVTDKKMNPAEKPKDETVG
jgi:hypothetical protein